MLYSKIWFDNIIKIDIIYKTNISNSYEIPQISKINLNIYSRSIIEDPKIYYIV